MTFKRLLKRLKHRFKERNRQRKLRKVRRLILQLTPNPIGSIGQAKSGTILKVKDVCFSVRHNSLSMKYTKVSRGAIKNNPRYR